MSRKIIAALFAALLSLAACGSDDDAQEATADDPSEDTDDANGAADGGGYVGPGDAGDTGSDDTADDATTDGDAPVVTTATTDLGEVLVDANGFTLYGFTQDSTGTPTCEGGCADTWPPVVVDSAEVPEGLDPSVFSVVERPDGSHQLKAGDWPLYTYAADGEPGETNGQGVGGVWFAVDPGGELIES